MNEIMAEFRALSGHDHNAEKMDCLESDPMAPAASQKDPFLWLEDLSAKKTISWVRKQDRNFRTKLKPRFPNLR
jgi:hypothetical protein